jgi:hypothetical protein
MAVDGVDGMNGLERVVTESALSLRGGLLTSTVTDYERVRRAVRISRIGGLSLLA